VTSITSLSALVSSLVAGSISDLIGRKPTIFFCALVFVVGALWQALSPTVTQIVIGRWIVGLGVGCGSTIIPMYITELSPTHLRPQLITMNAVFITFGQVIANLVGLAFSHTESGWRQMFAIGALPAAIQILLLFALPESPRYLASKGKREQASLILTKVYGFKQDDSKTGRVVDNILRGIDRSIKKEQGEVNLVRKWSILFKRGNRRALYICGGLQALQQLCGFVCINLFPFYMHQLTYSQNALIYYSPTIYSGLGFKDPILPSLALTTTNFLFTLTSLILIPKFGKRKVLLWSMTIMWVSLLIVGYAFRFVATQQSLPSILDQTMTSPNNHNTALNVILISTTIYVAAYAIGLGNIPWQQAEMFPLVVRGLGTSLATSCNWSSNFIVGATFLGLIEGAGASYTFLMFVVVCILGQCGVYWRYPDTDGIELEDVAEMFDREGG